MVHIRVNKGFHVSVCVHAVLLYSVHTCSLIVYLYSSLSEQFVLKVRMVSDGPTGA